MNTKIQHFLICTSLLLCFLSILSCGGGTAGTGGSDLRIYEGRVVTTTSQPLGAVTVGVAGTPDQTETNMDGSFSLSSPNTEGPVTLDLTSKSLQTSVTLRKLTKTDTRVALNITVDEADGSAQIVNYAAHVGMVGACDHFFENGKDSIRQANFVPEGTECRLRVRVFGDGHLLSSLPVGIQYSSCGPDAVWTELVKGYTGTGAERGIATIPFPFKSTPEFCKYRVLVPYNLVNRWPLAFKIETFESQSVTK